MNARKIKMALTAGLINQNSNNNALHAVRNLMTDFTDEVGHFTGLRSLGNRKVGNATQERYALKYEHCTLNIEVLSMPQRQTVRGFQLM